MKVPLVFEIKGNSLDDGPGIRSVVFFKGCPLSCVWCHNPEGMRPDAEISYDRRECVGCGTCLAACPEGALSRANPAFIDRRRCTLCFHCAEACPSGALKRVGRQMTAAAIAEEVLRDKPFYDTSGGGVTLSGGEPTLGMEFVSELLRHLKSHGVHCLIETCGFFDGERFMALLYPHLDAMYFDLKIHDTVAHRRSCGVPNGAILENFRRLAARTRKDGKVLLPRIPLIPGITATDRNLRAWASFLQAAGIQTARLLPYNPLWPDKAVNLGISEAGLAPVMRQWQRPDQIRHCKAIFRDHGIQG
ncbi:MAG: glycyl-radical enzyme activating protein [Thermodesulfobacteriota bacterium]